MLFITYNPKRHAKYDFDVGTVVEVGINIGSTAPEASLFLFSILVSLHQKYEYDSWKEEGTSVDWLSA